MSNWVIGLLWGALARAQQHYQDKEPTALQHRPPGGDLNLFGWRPFKDRT
jgi:hypothetical protein